jgi:hypothetical protein
VIVEHPTAKRTIPSSSCGRARCGHEGAEVVEVMEGLDFAASPCKFDAPGKELSIQELRRSHGSSITK